MNANVPGRTCPIRYRYGASALAQAPERQAETLYVVGGLYGNLPALECVEAMARAEDRAATLCFNGDFNWFDVADETFVEVNTRVLRHDAILGNVEAEFTASSDDAGCGCAYPAYVETAVVERSNRIHRELKATARRHPAVLRQIASLPMYARYRVGRCRVGVVHGDADSLAGWGFDAQELCNPEQRQWLLAVLAAAGVDVFASTHTCLPAMRRVDTGGADGKWIVNNGAAGMPNFEGKLFGLCTRIATTASPNGVLHEVEVAGIFVALVPIFYDTVRWQAQFLAQWPAGSPAWLSYFDRIAHGPAYRPSQVLGAGAPGNCRSGAGESDTRIDAHCSHARCDTQERP